MSKSGFVTSKNLDTFIQDLVDGEPEHSYIRFECGEQVRTFEVEEEQLILLETRPYEWDLPGLLAARGLLNEGDLDEIRDIVEEQNREPSRVIINGGYATEEQLKQGVRRQGNELALDMFLAGELKYTWPGETEMDRVRDSGHTPPFTIELEVTNFVETGVSRRRKSSSYQKQIEDIDSLFQLHEGVDSGEAYEFTRGPVEKHILDLLMEGKPPRDIARFEPYSLFEILNCLQNLMGHGAIRELPVDQILSRADQKAKENDLEEAIRLYEWYLAHVSLDAELRANLADLLERADQNRRAADIYHDLAEEEKEEGNADREIEYRRKALSCYSEDPRFAEELFNALEIYDRKEEIIPVGRGIIYEYLDRGETSEAFSILERLIEINPESPDVHITAAELRADTDPTFDVAQDRLEKARGRMEDPEHPEQEIDMQTFRERIRDICREPDLLEPVLARMEQDQHTFQTSRYSSYAVIISCLVGGLVVALLGWYQIQSESAFRTARQEANDLRSDQAFEEAIQRLADFQNQYPYSFRAVSARGLIEDIEQDRKEYHGSIREDYEEQISQLLERYWNIVDVEQSTRDAEFTEETYTDLFDDMETLQEQMEREETNLDEQKENLSRMESHLQRRAERGRQLREEGQEHLEAERYRQAHRELAELVTNYSGSPAAREVELPVRFVCYPPDSQLFVEGEQVEGRSPFLRMMTPGEPAEYTVRRNGYHQKSGVVNPDRTHEVSVELEKKYNWRKELDTVPISVVSPPTSDTFLLLFEEELVSVNAEGNRETLEILPDDFRTAGEPAFLDHLLLIPGQNEDVLAVHMEENPQIGQRWRQSIRGWTSYRPALLGEQDLIVPVSSGFVHLSAETGEVQNRFSTNSSPSTDLLHHREKIYGILSNGQVVVFSRNTSGELRRESRTLGPLGSAPVGQPVIIQNQLVTARQDRNISALNLDTGELEILMEFDAPIRHGLFYREDGGSVLFSTRDNTLYMLENGGREFSWEYQFSRNLTISPHFGPGYILVGLENNTVEALDRNTGEVIWTLPVDGPPAGFFLTHSGGVSFYTENPFLYGVQVD